MGVSVDDGGGGGGRNVNVDLNIVPYIDMMSCLTAFLLMTAVWTNIAQIQIKPKGVGRDAEQELPTEPPINLSVLVAQDSLWVGLTTGERQQIVKDGEDYDWAALNEALKAYKESAVFTTREDVEVAAEDGVIYQDIVNAMDTAIASGFKDIGFVDPASLSVRFKQ